MTTYLAIIALGIYMILWWLEKRDRERAEKELERANGAVRDLLEREKQILPESGVSFHERGVTTYYRTSPDKARKLHRVCACSGYLNFEGDSEGEMIATEAQLERRKN